MANTVLENAESLLNPEAKRIRFDPGFQAVREEHLFYIPNFPVPGHLEAALAKPDLFEDLSQELLDQDEVQAIISIDYGNPKPPVVYFQAFDRRYSLASRGWVFMDGKTFRPLERQGITLSSNVDAVLDSGTLYFVSPAMVRRVLDFSAVFEPATNERLTEFADHDLFHCDDKAGLIEIADTVVRKRVSRLLSRGILSQVAIPEIAEIASQFDVEAKVVERDGKERLAIPTDRAGIKNLLTLLEEKYYLAPLTSRRMEASGNRYLD